MAYRVSVSDFDDLDDEKFSYSSSRVSTESPTRPHSITVSRQAYKPPLSKDLIVRILKNPISHGFTTRSQPVNKPPGGSVYVYEIVDTERKRN